MVYHKLMGIYMGELALYGTFPHCYYMQDVLVVKSCKCKELISTTTIIVIL